MMISGFNAAALRLMAAKGLTLVDAAEIAEAMEAAPSAAAVRQKRYRDNKRDVTRDVTPPPYEDTSIPPPVTPVEASASTAPLGEAVEIFNEVASAVGWPKVNTINPTRRRSLKARLSEVGLDGWRSTLIRARQSPYLGRDPPGWFTFDWLIKSSNFLKLNEGNYDRRRSDGANGMGRNQPSDGLSATTRAALRVFGPAEAGDEHRVPQ